MLIQGIYFFKLNNRYYLYILFKKDTNFYFKSKSTDKLVNKMKNLITIIRKNFIIFKSSRSKSIIKISS